MLKVAVYDSYVNLPIQHRSEVWCLKEHDKSNLRRIDRSTMRTMCGVQFKDRKRDKVLMLFSLNEIMHQLAREVCFGMVM